MPASSSLTLRVTMRAVGQVFNLSGQDAILCYVTLIDHRDCRTQFVELFGGDLRQHFRCRCDGRVDVFVGVCNRNEIGFELAARQIDASVKHTPKIPSEAASVAVCRNCVASHGFGVEEQREHAADLSNRVRQTGVAGSLLQASDQPRRRLL